MSENAERFDDWIRTRFIDINTELEELYFAQDDRADTGMATKLGVRQALIIVVPESKNDSSLCLGSAQSGRIASSG